MCVGYLALNTHPKYAFVAAFNRDEFFSRPSVPAHFWKDAPGMLAGKDPVGGGTWMGMTREGRFAVVTNIRTGRKPELDRLSRGRLVSDYLTGNQTPEDFLKAVIPAVDHYNPFNLLLGSVHHLVYFSSRTRQSAQLSKGIHGVSNGQLDEPWEKVRRGKLFLTASLSTTGEDLQEGLLQLLGDCTLGQTEELPSTGVSQELEHKLSAICVCVPERNYGTRSSTVILVDRQGRGTFVELTYASLERDAPVERREFRLFLGQAF